MLKQELLIIGHTFPEPNTTGAGNRMMQLIELFVEYNYNITFASTSNESEHSADLEYLGISVKQIFLNQSDFDTFITELDPAVVIYDRFMTEEQFGWRVAEFCPQALRVLDTEDLHFLRKAREEAVSSNTLFENTNLFSDLAKRELASVLRCDISLIISEFEMTLLKDIFRVPEGLLFYLPFLIDYLEIDRPSFDKRSDFMTIGNLLHKPNIDSIVYLKSEIWPLIKKELPNSKMHVYGAYAPQKISDLHNEKDGFLIEGWVSEVSEVMKKARICLAPLRFGAGLKGKLLDAMQYGVPSITTSVGAEGLFGDLPAGCLIADDPTEFAASAIQAYTDKIKWLEIQQNGYDCIRHRFMKEQFSKKFLRYLNQVKTNLMQHRQTHFIGSILHHRSLLSSKYMSKWIEEKNKRN